MGIQSDSFVYSIPENCYCIICKSVLEDPVEIISCGHHFCCKCFESWKERQTQTKVNNNCSTFFDIIFGLPEGSILGPLLFTNFICELFHDNADYNIANYADDNMPYCSELSLKKKDETL